MSPASFAYRKVRGSVSRSIARRWPVLPPDDWRALTTIAASIVAAHDIEAANFECDPVGNHPRIRRERDNDAEDHRSQHRDTGTPHPIIFQIRAHVRLHDCAPCREASLHRK